MSHSQHKPIAIVGAGLMGRLLAWRLLRQGYKVTLFDKDLSGRQSAGFIAAAMISPISEAMAADIGLYHEGKKNLSIWQQWLTELNQVAKQSIDFQFDGSLVVSHPQDKALFDRFTLKLNQLAIDTVDFAHCRPETREPELAHFAEAIELLPEGYIDNVALFSALKTVIDTLGGQWVEQCIDNTKEALPSDCSMVIDCRGMGAKKALPALRGVRGEILRVHAPEVTLHRPIRFLHPRYQLYIVPRPKSEYVIGATQLESEDTRQMTVRSALELLSALYSLHTGFAEAEIISFSAGLRPAFLDNLPKIQETSQGLSLNGFFRHGYLLSPMFIEQTIQRISATLLKTELTAC
ncbi:MAG: FAD-dependent oxidoreductase [Cellvibrionales bacterium]|nr:FAD-dependent oxidoreductase [Cellvibrionales bacterium]